MMSSGERQPRRQHFGSPLPIPVGIVQASAVAREALERAFSARPWCAGVHTFTSMQELLNHPVQELRVLLCDWETAARAGYPPVSELSLRVPEAKVVFFNVARTPQAVAECMLIGAIACFFEGSPPDEVVEGTLAIARAATPLRWYVLEALAGSTARASGNVLLRPGLTRRERETLRLVAHGLSNKEIAQRLSLRPQTVKNYLRQGFQKLGVRGRRDLVGLLKRDQ